MANVYEAHEGHGVAKVRKVPIPVMFEAYAPASALINAKHEGLYYFGSVDRYLRIASGEDTRDVLATAREGLRVGDMRCDSDQPAAPDLGSGAAGHPGKNIAADLGISQRTVDNHRAAIMRKTGSTSLPALIRTAIAAALATKTAGAAGPASWL